MGTRAAMMSVGDLLVKYFCVNLVCVNFMLSDRKKVFTPLPEIVCCQRFEETYYSLFIIQLSESIRSSVPTQATRTQFCTHANNTHVNSFRHLRCFAQYTFTSKFYLFNEHFVKFYKFNVNV